MWVCPLTYLTTFLIGYFLSWALELLNLQGEATIYLDNDKENINCDLFIPPLANRLRRTKAQKALNTVVSQCDTERKPFLIN